MSHVEAGHKFLDILQHIWPYVTGVFAIIVGACRLWWTDRRDIKKRINENAEAIRVIAATMVTDEQLHACRDDVRKEDEKNLDIVFREIRIINSDVKQMVKTNGEQHQDIMKQIVRLHSEGG